MTSRKLRSRMVISRSNAPTNKSNVKLKQTKISDWLGSRSDPNSDESLSDSDHTFQNCSRPSDSDSVSEVKSAAPRKEPSGLEKSSNSTGNNGEDTPPIVLQLDGILTCGAPKCSYQTSFLENLERHKKTKHELKRLRCPHCEYVTHSKAAFTRHKSSHARRSFKCRLCDWTTPLRSSFMQHMKQTHEREERRKQGITRASEFGKKFKCSKCDFRAVGRQEIHLHNYSHETERKHKCSFPGCDHRSKTISALREHKRRHDGEAKKEFQCALCSKFFWTRSMLYAHIGQHTKELTVQCTKCDFVTNFRSSLKRHIRKHDKKSVQAMDVQSAGESIGVSISEASLEISDIVNRSPHRSSNDSATVLENERTQSRSEPEYYGNLQIIQHQRKNPQDLEKSIKSASRVKKKNTPTIKKPQRIQEKKYKCDHCDFTALYKCKIIRHAVVHRDPDDKIHSCSFPGCNFKTNREDYVKTHRRDVHKSTPDHFCPVDGCGFQTKWKDTFVRHKRIHEKKRKRDHQCPMCRKGFYDSAGLKRHINVHTGESKHKCSLCDYVTLDKTNFYPHRRKYHPGQECEPIKVM